MAAKKEKVRLGPPTRSERREQQMTESFSTLAEAMKIQADTNAALVSKLKDEPKNEQTRTVKTPDARETVEIPQPESAPQVIYKCETRGLDQIVQRGGKEYFGDDYQIIPPVIARFEDNTYRTADPKMIEGLAAKLEFRKRKNLKPRFIILKDEIAEALANPETDVKPKVSAEVTVDTPLEALI